MEAGLTQELQRSLARTHALHTVIVSIVPAYYHGDCGGSAGPVSTVIVETAPIYFDEASVTFTSDLVYYFRSSPFPKSS
ncbi:hypothetical protein RRG08_062024 [Elysia crispata]|uniref:Uncharacterized protein n=1 Tax=Elysia crispata TaxID=231223 RepID=A0AAE1DSV3_9GAST|nr:hypothetical protein RRG08_062024 [Elysia crispata]